MTGQVQDKIILITGAASGIGLATVELLIAHGAYVLAADVQDAKGAALQARFPQRLVYQHCDVTREDDIKNAIDICVGRFGGLDGIFNNAGSGGVIGPVESTELSAWNATMDLLLTSVFLGTKHAVPHLEKRGGGAIVNTASIAGLQAGWGPIAYSTAKAGVVHFSKVAAAELCTKKIRVNAICPGLIATSIFGASLGMPREQADQLSALVAAQGGAAQPAGRAGQGEDIAQAVLWLMSDAGSFVTGTHFVIDGGITIGPRHAWDPNTLSPFAQAMGLDQTQLAALAQNPARD
jgi:NAD(P)-dependent dehydrogenase (short-subunit alcohol dehydrogenase family)